MSEEEFLARWSRRKRAVESERQPEPPDEARTPEPVQPAGAQAEPGEPGSETVDLSALPSLESITAETDITAFLRSGVPEELTRSALRKAWSSDPAIRDFVGLAENAWDFNDPTAMPGFGPLDYTPEQVRQMAAKLVGGIQRASEQIERALGSTALQGQETPDVPPAETPVCAEAGPVDPASAAARDDGAAPQHEHIENIKSDSGRAHARRHGGALPS